MKLHLRDLFWLVLVCALAVGWWVDRRAVLSRVKSAEQAAESRIRQAENERDEAKTDLYKVSNQLWFVREQQAGTTPARP